MSLFLLSSSGIPDNLISIETATLTSPYIPKADLVSIRVEEKYGALAGKREGKEEKKTGQRIIKQAMSSRSGSEARFDLRFILLHENLSTCYLSFFSFFLSIDSVCTT